MPSYTFCGCIPYDFPETRDDRGVIVGRVNPGDERDFAEAPTADWFPSDGPLPKRLPDVEPEDEDAPESAPEPPRLPSPPALPPLEPPPATTPPDGTPENEG